MAKKKKMTQDAATRIGNCSTSDGEFVKRAEKAADKNTANQHNHQNQLNPNNDAYWKSRGYKKRPDNWNS